MKSLLVSIIVVLSYYCHSQPANISFQHYTTENGLSSNLVRHIVQDQYGFLWIGTTDGLNRFDGKTFTVYRNDSKDSNSLSNNIINGLSIDHSGKIWVATNGGLCYYSYADDAFHRIDISINNHETVDARRVHEVSAGKNKRIWYLTKTELHVLNEDGSIATFKINKDVYGEVNSLLVDSEERVWVGTNKGKLLLLNEDTGIFNAYNTATPQSSKRKNITVSIVKIIQHNKNELLLGTWYSGLQHVTISGNNISINACEDDTEVDDRKWIVTGLSRSKNATDQFWLSHFGSGISLFDAAKGKFIMHKRHEPSDAKSLCNDFVNTAFTDAAGTLWLGTDEGLDKYDELTNRFSRRMIPEFNKSGTVRRIPGEIIENSNDSSHQSLWIAVSAAGVFRYSRNNGSIKAFNHNERTNSLLSDFVYSLFMPDDGKLWIGTREGVCIYHEQQNHFELLKYDTTTPKPTYVSNIIKDRQGRFWFGSFRNGVYCYDPQTTKVVLYEHNEHNEKSLPDNHVFCIMEDHLGRIWAGTQNNGLSRLNEKTSEWTHFKHIPGDLNTIPENYIYALYEDDQQQLWIATENGLGIMDTKTEKVRCFSTADGLCNNDIFSFRKTKGNHMWLATTNGLSDYDITNNTFRNYYTMDGLPTNSLSGAFSCMSDGTIFMGVPGGLVFFNPSEIKSNNIVPPVVITSFSVFDKKYRVKRKGIELQPLELSYQESMITFGFAALNFTNSSNNMYAYMLEGFDKDWIYCGNKTTATYTNLDGGDYIFKVKACNNDGVWNEAGAFVPVSITPPFRKTIWFYGIIALLVALVLYLVYRIRIAQIMRLQHIRQRIARDLHDDIGSTLSSISMMSKMAYVNESTTKEKSGELFATIGKASTQAMELMSDIVWSVNPENDKMENIVSRMREYTSVLLDATDIIFKLDVNESAQHIELPMEKRKDFFLIFKEAVNNLAKYSGASHAEIKLYIKDHHLVMEISDDGKGFSDNDVITGNGLKNMRARAGQLGAALKIVSQKDRGTSILLSIPLVP